MEKTSFTLKCPPYYDLHSTCHAHGWKNLAPFYWDPDRQRLSFSMLVNDTPIDVTIHQKRHMLHVELVSINRLATSALEPSRAMIRRSLDLDSDISPLLVVAERAGPEYVQLIKAGAGRLLKSPTLWEDAAKTLFTTNCSWSLTRKMCAAVCSVVFSKPSPSSRYPFPPPHRFIRYSTNDLKRLMPIGYREDYLRKLAERFSEDPNLENLEANGYTYRQADEIIRRSKGFADYACAQLLVLAGYFNKIPFDTTVATFVKRNFPRVRRPNSFIRRRYRKWGDYKWWGYKFDTMLAKQNWLGD